MRIALFRRLIVGLALIASVSMLWACSDSGSGVQTDAASEAGGDSVGISDDSGPISTGQCGDGVCDGDEHAFNCVDDCPASGYVQCLMASCAKETSACSSLDGCLDILVCTIDCGVDATCAEACREDMGAAPTFILSELDACSATAGCVNAPIASDSCVSRCDIYAEDAACQCDATCALLDDCCPDYILVCEEGIVCGDGACSDGETPSDCPADCDEGPGPAGDGCIAEYCADEYSTCAASDQCIQGLECLIACGNSPSDCISGCFSGLDTEAATLLYPLAECWSQNCTGESVQPPTGEECGDGLCGPGEDAGSCEADCGGASSCIEEECGDVLAACYGDEACWNGVECIQACGDGDDACFTGCIEPIPESSLPPFYALIQCYQDNCQDTGDDPSTGPDGSCGDGECSEEEDATSCPIDCGLAGVDPTLECIGDACPDELSACFSDPDCPAVIECVLSQCTEADGIDCLIACGESAGFNQAVLSLGFCMQQSDCF